ncbi:MAG: type V CRISPR-associated protein Cas12a/Cpf1 [Clostridia bacterium]|nr:type V CRISPR-associated protein Cas12a/Cpf1 [Clostridia bacterium]
MENTTNFKLDNKEKLYEGLNYLYPLSKTLRFELKPIGKTRENIEKEGVLKIDKEREVAYSNVKKIIDDYHKDFIERTLTDFKLQNLEEHYNMFLKNDLNEDEKKEILIQKEKLRKQISKVFKDKEEYKGLFNKEMIQKYLDEYLKRNKIEDEKLKKDIEDFKRFTTYFTGFNKNRENMYSHEEKETAIAYRIINENMSMFINNIKIYEKIKEYIDEKSLIESIREIINKEVSLQEIFTIEYFNNCLTQKGITEYNDILSGYTKEDGTNVQGINQIVNLTSQKIKIKLPIFKKMYKQILSDVESKSFIIENFEKDLDVINAIKEYSKIINTEINRIDANIFETIKNIDKFDIYKIYINKNENLTKFSNEVLDDWSKIYSYISRDYDDNYLGENNIGTKKYVLEKEKHLKKVENYSIGYLKDIIFRYDENRTNIIDYIKQLKYKSEENNILNNVKTSYDDLLPMLVVDNKNLKGFIKDQDKTNSIKKYLDYIKDLQKFIEMFDIEDKTIEKDEVFYSRFAEALDNIKLINPLYNKIRNYLTQKPYSTNKVKINFDNALLLSGWDLNKEEAKTSVIFEKDNNYYLGIMNKKHRKIFINKETKIDENVYRKMVYKLLPGPNKMLPKVFLSKKGQETFKTSEYIIDKYNRGMHKKGENFDMNFCHELIDFFKESINLHEDWKNFDFKFSDTKTYADISQFYREVERQGYKISFSNYSEEYINELVDSGKLYLFQIYNKDFSQNKKNNNGKPNLHTMYWKALFEKDNLDKGVYKLNGEAEMFYREASLKKEVTHDKGIPIDNKNTDTKKRKPKSTFNYDLIKDKRFTEDKFMFHVPITLNFNNHGINNINYIVNENIKKIKANYIIGIDRGERNLIYVVVIDERGKIVEQLSLNDIINNYNGVEYKTEYHNLLEKREIERDISRKNWGNIKNIKELKEGYLSQVVHKISELLIKYNAILVLEDLNYGFKNSRIKFEKQVYQKFEKMLIDKLNYLVFKSNNQKEAGGLLNAYQLTNKFSSFKKLEKQTGILFYIPAWQTSKIDPTTGFSNLLSIKYENKERAQSFISTIDDIRYNKESDYYEFDIDYSKFNIAKHGIKSNWTICTYGTRIFNKKNGKVWESKEINLTEKWKEFFNKNHIENNNIKKEILSKQDAKVYEEFMFLFKLTMQIRNSVTSSNIDYMISPVKNKKGEFFKTNLENKKLPNDADANGAYNIAKKGAMLLEQIKKSNTDKIKFNISNDEWLKYAQENILEY